MSGRDRVALRPLLDEVQQAAEALRIVDFDERKQQFFCRACRYRDPLIDGNKLHADNCPWVHFVRTFKKLHDLAALGGVGAAATPPTEDEKENQSRVDRQR